MNVNKALIFDGLRYTAGAIGIIVVWSMLAIFGYLVGVAFGSDKGFRSGYIQALDDARLGKPARYKLVQTAEKWVEVHILDFLICKLGYSNRGIS